MRSIVNKKIFSDKLEQVRIEKGVEALFAPHKDKLTTASTGFTIPPEDVSYIESRTG